MFTDEIAHAIIDAAKEHDIEPAALLALVEVETSGDPFESDGRTPRLLYERHVAWREAKKVGQGILNAFARAGLAIPKWNRATQYKDQGSSARRLQLIGRARAIHKEVANRSASWGLGQTMGFLAEEMGFPDANAMVEHMTGSVAGQLDCMIRELKNKGLIRSLNDHDWKRVARIYNGSGYAANKYDTRIGDAYVRWSRKIKQLVVKNKPREVPPEQLLAKDEVEAIQAKLRDLGFFEVGAVEGGWGTRTTGAISAFQAHQGLPVTGHYDEATKDALDAAEVPRAPALDRELATADDLRDKGSKTIQEADKLTFIGRIGKALGIGLGGGAAAEQTGLLDQAQGAIEKVDQVKSIWDGVHDFVSPFFANPTILILGVLLFVGFWVVGCYAKRIIEARVADHRSGIHAGPEC